MSRPLTKTLPMFIVLPLVPPRPYRQRNIIIPLRQILPIRSPRMFKLALLRVSSSIRSESGVPGERRGGGDGAVFVGCVDEGGDEDVWHKPCF